MYLLINRPLLGDTGGWEIILTNVILRRKKLKGEKKNGNI
jgi:hypothetical protein